MASLLAHAFRVPGGVSSRISSKIPVLIGEVTTTLEESSR